MEVNVILIQKLNELIQKSTRNQNRTVIVCNRLEIPLRFVIAFPQTLVDDVLRVDEIELFRQEIGQTPGQVSFGDDDIIPHREL